MTLKCLLGTFDYRISQKSLNYPTDNSLSMSNRLASLYKILKDEKRQKIIVLLNEKGSVGYTELLDASETGSTGLLNYHLKVLGDLITKNEKGEYLLTDKGKLASSVLLNFPAEGNPAQKRRAQDVLDCFGCGSSCHIDKLHNFLLSGNC